MRGKQTYRQTQSRKTGITPAGAGKTKIPPVVLAETQDHPRRCGENDSINVIGNMNTGSPPQVRGKRERDVQPRKCTGITPAGAGKTECSRSAAQKAEDHPRRCGENRASLDALIRHKGSPPQVRGKRDAAGHIGRIRGITPAGAGKTGKNRERRNQPRDHPRRCGENL